MPRTSKLHKQVNETLRKREKKEKLIKKYEIEYKKGNIEKQTKIEIQLNNLGIRVEFYTGYVMFFDNNLNVLYEIKR